MYNPLISRFEILVVNAWFYIMSSCANCSQSFIVNNDCIACDLCDSWLHFSCTNLNSNEFLSHCDDFTLSWTCSTCDTNTKCQMPNAKCQMPNVKLNLYPTPSKRVFAVIIVINTFI